MSEEREVLLVGGPRDGQPVRYRAELVQLGFDLADAVNTARTIRSGGKYVKRRYQYPRGKVLELFVWLPEEAENE
jgi:hypothetical protein